MNENLARLIRSYLDREAGDRVIHFNGGWITRGWLRDLVESIKRAIDAMDLPPRAAIAVVPQNSPEFIAVLMALLERGDPVTMVYAYQSNEALAAKVEALTPALVIAAAAQLQGPMLEAARAIGCGALAITPGRCDGAVLAPFAAQPGVSYRRVEGEPGIEMLTSGTTGAPKLCPLSYSQIFGRLVIGNSMAGAEPLPFLHFFPLGNISGLYSLLPPVSSNAPIIMIEKFSLGAWVDFIRTTKPRMASLPPIGFRMILEEGVPPADLASLKFLQTGAATLDPTDRKEFESAYPIAILQSYGATEFGGVVAAMTPDHIAAFGDAKSDSVGRPWGENRLRIVDPESGEALPAGTAGKVEVLAPAIGAEWIPTTDLGLLDEDGFLYHRGRLDGAIMRGGFKINPEEVAQALIAHPGVAAAAVVGVPDARLGQVPAAAVQLREGHEGMTREELENHLRARLPKPSLPVHYHFAAALPRTPSLKVDMRGVAALFAENSAQEG